MTKPITIVMDPKWATLLVSFLRELSDKMSDASCNDWDWPADWTDADRLAFARFMTAGENRTTPENLSAVLTKKAVAAARDRPPGDFRVVDALARLVENQTAKHTSRP